MQNKEIEVNKMKLILASGSKYRAQLLKKTNIDFTQIAPSTNEDVFKAKITDPISLAQTLAKEKCLDIFKQNPSDYCIGSDQLGHFENIILGKPHTKEKALEQLSMLNGKKHSLITAVHVLGPNFERSFVDITTLKMRVFDIDQLKKYIELDSPLDCAGSYKLEENGITLFEKIETIDHTAITGLPLLKLTDILIEAGLKPFEN